jgi:predicted nucleotidyltransferase
MKKKELTKEEITGIIRDYLISKGIKKASLFGSFVRDDFDSKKSDIDIIIQRWQTMTLFDFIRMRNDIEALVQRKIDMVEYGALKPLIKDDILSTAVTII